MLIVMLNNSVTQHNKYIILSSEKDEKTQTVC